jgi:hypothetical protein
MDKIRLLLSLITIAIIVGPIAGILLVYQNNLLGLVITPEIDKITNMMTSETMNDTIITEKPLEPPTFVGSSYNITSQTVELTFNFTNPFKFDLTISSMLANIECDAHKFPIGNATLNTPFSMHAGETAMITLFVTWTQEALNHFQTAHAEEKSIDVDLVNLTISLKGINVQTNESIEISNVPIQ